jgi:hypothetical protein
VEIGFDVFTPKKRQSLYKDQCNRLMGKARKDAYPLVSILGETER